MFSSISKSNIKGVISSLERKNGMSSSIDNDYINLGRQGTILFIEEDTTINGDITGSSSLFISGVSTLQGAITGMSSLNISGVSTLQGATTVLSSLNVSGVSTLQGATTVLSSLNVSGVSTLQGATTVLSSLNVSGVSTINNTLNALEIKQQYQTSPALYALLVPTGSILSFAGSAAPHGWLLCDGSAMLIATYATLYAVIGTTYGGNGTTTFGLPDLRSRMPIGAGSGSGLSTRTLASTGGSETHTLSISEMPSHTHTATDAGHTHSITDLGHLHNIGTEEVASGSGAVVANNDQGNLAPTAPTLSSTTGITINTGYASISVGYQGGGSAHTIMNPYIVLNFIIKF
jgi:microcystin-dependent protein